MNDEYSIYCDESDTNGQNIFWLGAIICSPTRAKILNDKIKIIRNKYNFYSEFKWTKLKKHNFGVYKEFVDAFFDDKYVKFRLMSCKEYSHKASKAIAEFIKISSNYSSMLMKYSEVYQALCNLLEH